MSGSKGDPTIRVCDLAVDLGGTRVLDGVDLTVSAGSFVGLVGPNGAGKTTLLRTINGALDPARGTVEVVGRPVHDCTSREASRLVATVPQTADLAFTFSVREVVAMGRTPHVPRFGRIGPDDRATVEEAMSRTAVTALADRPVTAVSGGERSRVLLARALAQDTPVLLLDEPTANLDVNHQVRTLDLVSDLVADGRTILAAIHDLNLAARYCDELVLLVDGTVLAAGAPDEVLTESAVETAFGIEAIVFEHPITGTVAVTALSEAEGEVPETES